MATQRKRKEKSSSGLSIQVSRNPDLLKKISTDFMKSLKKKLLNPPLKLESPSGKYRLDVLKDGKLFVVEQRWGRGYKLLKATYSRKEAYALLKKLQRAEERAKK